MGNTLTVKYMVYPMLGQVIKSNIDLIISNLVELGKALGEEAVVHVYIPYIYSLLQKHSSRATKGEDTLASVLQLLQGVRNA